MSMMKREPKIRISITINPTLHDKSMEYAAANDTNLSRLISDLLKRKISRGNSEDINDYKEIVDEDSQKYP